MHSPTCLRCGSELGTHDHVCSRCGTSNRVDLVDAVITERNTSTGDARISVRDPMGARSEAHGDAGRYTVDVTGAGGVGKKSEGRISETLRSALISSGRTATIQPGADDRGEDRLLTVDDRTFDLQITIAPNAPDFWRKAHLSSASTQVGQTHALGWLRAPVETKARRLSDAQRANTLLAIDVTHAGVIADATFRDRYVACYGSPDAEFGFASVWVVGPHAEYCGRLGTGFP